MHRGFSSGRPGLRLQGGAFTRVALAAGLVLTVGVAAATVLSNSRDDTTVALGTSALSEEAAAL